MTIETKMNAPVGANADVRLATTEIMGAFEALKAANDARRARLPLSNPADRLIDFVYALKPQFQANARFTMNCRTISAVRKLMAGDGNYLTSAPMCSRSPLATSGAAT